jgi:archaeal flagellin FlaB
MKILSLARLLREQKGITGIETAIILIAFVVVASVFAYSTLSAGLFSAEKSREAVYSGLEEIQGTLELRGGILGHRDTLNTAGSGSLGKLDITLILFSSGSQVDLTSAYTVDPGSGALLHSNPGANRIQIVYSDHDITISDCAWTARWIGRNNSDNMLDPNEKVVMTVWLHTFNGAVWGPAGSENSPFLGSFYVDTYHNFTLEVMSAKGATLTLQRTTPAYLDPVVDLK